MDMQIYFNINPAFCTTWSFMHVNITACHIDLFQGSAWVQSTIQSRMIVGKWIVVNMDCGLFAMDTQDVSNLFRKQNV